MSKKKDLELLEAQSAQRKYLEVNGYKSCCNKTVEIFGRSVFKQERIVYVTDLALILFKEKKNKPCDKFKWQNIRGVDLKGDQLHLNFEDGFVGLKTNEMAVLFGAISDVLMHVLTRDELEEVGVLKFQTQEVFPNSASIFSRFRNMQSILRIKVSQESLDIIKTGIMEMCPILDLGKFRDLKAILPLIYDLLKIAKFVSTVIVPDGLSVDPFLIAAEIVYRHTYVENISFDCSPTKSFNDFVDALGNGQSNVLGLYFKKGSLNEKQLSDLGDAFDEKQMATISFNSCIDETAMHFFYESFLATKVNKTLTVLNLDNTKNVNLSSLLLSLPSLSVLSIANCGMEISGIFKAIFDAPVIKLRALNISKNLSRYPVGDFRTMPSSLTSVTCDNVEWNEGTMIPFMRLVLKSFKTGVKLSMTHATTTTEEYNKVFNFLCQSQFKCLSGFIWDGNPVEERLFEFLNKNQGIECLSLNGCFDKTFEGPILALVNFLSKAPRIKMFHAAGNEKSNFGPYTSKVCRALKNCPTLGIIDLSESHSGTDGLISMCQLMEADSKRVVILDGVYPANPEPFFKLVSLAFSNPNVLLSYPTNDMKWIRDNNMTSEEQMDFIQTQFQRVPKQKSHKKSKYAPPAVSSFDYPFYVYKNYDDPGFPVFFTKHNITELRAVTTTQIVSQPSFLPNLPISKKLDDRMLQARRMIYGEEIQEEVVEKRDPPTYVPQTTITTVEEMEIDDHECLSTQSSHRRRKTRGIVEQSVDDLPKDNESRTTTRTTQDVEQQARSSSRSMKSKRSKKATKSIIRNWDLPEITLDVDINQFWESNDDQFSIQNLYFEVKELKKPPIQ